MDKNAAHSFLILFLVLASFGILDSTFMLSQNNELTNENGVLFLKPSEKVQVQEIRKDYNGIIYIPEENLILGSVEALERDGEEIKKIVGRWNK